MCTHDFSGSLEASPAQLKRLRTTVMVVGLLNFTYFFVEGWTGSGWPDLILAAIILVLNLSAAKEVWEVSEEERLTAKALEGDID